MRYHWGVSRPMDAGLCGQCAWSRFVAATVSTFTMCTRGLTDPAYAKYPRLPVRACRGYEPGNGVSGNGTAAR